MSVGQGNDGEKQPTEEEEEIRSSHDALSVGVSLCLVCPVEARSREG